MGHLKHQDIQGNGGVSDGTPSATIISSPGTGAYLHLQKVNLSVYVASSGGSGVLYLKSTDESIFHVVDVSSLAKNNVVDFGEEGYQLPVSTGFSVTVAGATTQASCSVIATGFWKTSIQ